jgi:hypothetical protein
MQSRVFTLRTSPLQAYLYSNIFGARPRDRYHDLSHGVLRDGNAYFFDDDVADTCRNGRCSRADIEPDKSQIRLVIEDPTIQAPPCLGRCHAEG